MNSWAPEQNDGCDGFNRRTQDLRYPAECLSIQLVRECHTD